MAKRVKPSEEESRRLVGIRVPVAVHDVLEMARVFEGAPSLQELLAPLIESEARRYAEQPEIKQALELRERYTARRTGKLTDLRRGRQKT